ncbi:MAG: glucosamine inositolphosphorylceramide transferase family protein [Solirubrobacteraceae bacterium]
MSADHVRRAIAVVLDGPPTPAWQARALSNLQSSDSLNVVEVRTLGAEDLGPLHRLHARIDRHLLYPGPDALAPVALERGPERDSMSGTPATLTVWLSQRPLPPADDARELLYLRHGGRVEPADHAFRRAVLGGSQAVHTEALLRRSDGSVVVERTVSGVRAFSVTLSRDQALWKLAELVRRAAERASEADWPASAPASQQWVPSIAATVASSLVAWPRVLANRALYRRPWSVRVRRRAQQPTAGWGREEVAVRWADGHMYADPFLFEHEGRHHLFCEDVGGDGRGVICHSELVDEGASEMPVCVLARPYHLSYPFVFAHDGETFMIPETSAVKRVELYRATDFPRSWEREAILLDDIDAADATLLVHDGRLWLFAAVAASGASSLDELHLFSASELRGPWQAHPRNPVVSDARRARPAGAIQRWGTRLVRPGQDGSSRYGGAVAFCEIDAINESDYAEHEIARLAPAGVAGARATHTYNSDRAFEAIDVRRREPRLIRLLGRRAA